MRNRLVLKLFAASVTLLCTQAAQAAYLTASYAGGGGSGYLTGTAWATYTGLPGANGNYQTGNYRFTRTGGVATASQINQAIVQSNSSGTIWTFCLELNQGLLDPVHFNARSVESNAAGTSTVMTTNQGDAIRQLWHRYRSSVITSTAAAAFQLAIWEIAFDSAANWGAGGQYIGTTTANLLEEGMVQNKKGAGAGTLEGDDSKRILANTWLKSLTSNTGTGWGLSKLARLASEEDQDQVVELKDGWDITPGGLIEAVPVPPAVVLVVAGVASGLFLRRRIAGQQAAVVA